MADVDGVGEEAIAGDGGVPAVPVDDVSRRGIEGGEAQKMSGLTLDGVVWVVSNISNMGVSAKDAPHMFWWETLLFHRENPKALTDMINEVIKALTKREQERKDGESRWKDDAKDTREVIRDLQALYVKEKKGK